MYYKIIKGGLIVDACEKLNYVRWQSKNGLFLSCDQENADGVLSSRGDDIYLMRDIGNGQAEYATCVEITKEEYDALREELDAGEIIEYQNGGTDTPAKTRMQALEDRVAELTEANSMLTECLLEMSQIVYGEG